MSSRTQFALSAAGLGLVLVLVLVLVAVLFLIPRNEVAEVPGLRELSRSELDLRDGMLYVRGESEPFDGTLLEFFPGEVKRIALEIREGKAHGVSYGWYENGQLEVEEHFVRGVSHGRRTRYYQNGAKKSEAQIVEGKIEGVFTRWHENGRKAAVAVMVGGTPHGVSEAWYESGARKSRVVLQAGEVVSKEFFDDGGTL